MSDNKISNFFFGHLREADENYFQHLHFTLKVSFILFTALIVLVIHGFLPFTFKKTASRKFNRVSKIFDKRVQQIQAKTSGIVNYAEAI